MEVNLTEKKIVIIGATDVLGYTCAEVLASEGCSLALIDSDMAALKAITAQLREGHDVSITSHAGDISDLKWQSSVLEIIQPADHILFNWTRFVFDTSSNPKNSEALKPVGLIDANRIGTILEFCSLALNEIVDRDNEGVFITLLGSLSYAAANRVSNLESLSSEFWPVLEASARVFTESVGKKYPNIRGIAIEVLGEISESGDATVHEIQIADTVAFLLSERSAAIKATTLKLVSS